MSSPDTRLDALNNARNSAELKILVLGKFELIRKGELVATKEWSRDHTLQLFQYLILSRHRRALHKEQIIDRIWEDVDDKSGEQRFKVSMHGLNKILEPDRPSRSDTKFIKRQGVSYYFDTNNVWIDIEACDQYITLANEALSLNNLAVAKSAYSHAINLYGGTLLPSRIYNDWTSSERERIQILILGAMMNLAELNLESNPLETIRLTQNALQIDHTWEEAYGLQIKGHLAKGNRSMALKVFETCKNVLDEEFGLEPLPSTIALVESI